MGVHDYCHVLLLYQGCVYDSCHVLIVHQICVSMKLTRPHVRRHGYLKADEPCPARMDREIRFELSDVDKVRAVN